MRDLGDDSELTVLLDHANIPFNEVSFLEIVRAWLDTLRASGSSAAGVATVRARAYGGWYIGDRATDDRYEAADFYQRTCPSVFVHDGRYYRMTFEFADYQVFLPSSTPFESVIPVRVTHTVAVRSSPMYMTQVGSMECHEVDCQVEAVRRWIRKRRGCTKTLCPHGFGQVFRRLEQKQVDVHMALDLQSYALDRSRQRCIALASDDIDLLPALVAAAVNRRPNCGLSLLRFSTSSSYLDTRLGELGVNLIRVGRGK